MDIFFVILSNQNCCYELQVLKLLSNLKEEINQLYNSDLYYINIAKIMGGK